MIRFRLGGSKVDFKPVFDINDPKFLNHLNVEMKRENTAVLWNNGLAFIRKHKGNLGVEANNHYFNNYEWYGKAKQGLGLSLSRTTIAYIQINRIQFLYWHFALKQKYKLIFDEFKKLFSSLEMCTAIQQQAKMHPTPIIKMDYNTVQNIVIEEIKERGIKFRFGVYDKITYQDALHIQLYINSQSASWRLTDETLVEMFKHFNGRFPYTSLIRICRDYGYDYKPRKSSHDKPKINKKQNK